MECWKEDQGMESPRSETYSPAASSAAPEAMGVMSDQAEEVADGWGSMSALEQCMQDSEKSVGQSSEPMSLVMRAGEGYSVEAISVDTRRSCGGDHDDASVEDAGKTPGSTDLNGVSHTVDDDSEQEVSNDSNSESAPESHEEPRAERSSSSGTEGEASPCSPPVRQVLKTGIVYKLSYRKTRWKPRWAEIRLPECELFYYNREEEAVRELKGIISLSDCVVHINPPLLMSDRDSRPEFIIRIEAERSCSLEAGVWWISRDYHFAVKTAAELQEWKSALAKAKEQLDLASWTNVTIANDRVAVDGKFLSEHKYHRGKKNLSTLYKNQSSLYYNSMRYVSSQAVKFAKMISGEADSASTKSVANNAVHMLGFEYHPCATPVSKTSVIPIESPLYASFHRDFASRIWFTYRKDIPPIAPKGLTSDAGWGCMLRCGQMLLAEAMLQHFVGRGWRFDPNRPPPRAYVDVLRMFQDDPSAPFSVHKIAQAGELYDKSVGEWFGPSTIAQVMKHLMMVGPMDTIGVYVADNGVLYRNEIQALCTSRHGGSMGAVGVDSEGNPAWEWRSSILLVPLRLGGDCLNGEYAPRLEQFFSLQQCLGMLGGRPRSAFYYVAARSGQLYYLDPHTVQSYVHMERNYETSSYHCRVVHNMESSKIDPSVCLAFYCNGESDFEDLCTRLAKMAANDTHPIVSVASSPPPSPRAEMAGALSEEDDDWDDAGI